MLGRWAALAAVLALMLAPPLAVGAQDAAPPSSRAATASAHHAKPHHAPAHRHKARAHKHGRSHAAHPKKRLHHHMRIHKRSPAG